MSDRSDLKKVARAIYNLTRRSEWLGGKGNSKDWPKPLKDLNGPEGWIATVTWSLSPEVLLAGHRMRVCVSWDGFTWHRVRVIVDDELKHPGGWYAAWNGWFGGWSWRIANLERADGGKTGPIDIRDKVLKAAKNGGDPPSIPPPVYCDACYQVIETALAQGSTKPSDP